MSSFGSKPEIIKILLIEDNSADVRLIQETLKDYKMLNKMDVIMDGEEAMAYLKKTGKYKNNDSPDIILLDLNLPKKDGREILGEVKNNPELKMIPVIVFTSSAADKDIVDSYNLHANAYITKPVDLDQFIIVIKSIEEFWLSIVKLPKK